MKKKSYIFVFLFIIVGSFYSCEKEEDILSEKEEDLISEKEEDRISDNYLYPEIGEWFNYLCSSELGGRYSGSAGIKKAKNYICDIIGRSDSLTCDSFHTPKCEMTNIIFHIKGVSDSLIVIGAHYDAFGYYSRKPLPGADDNLSGTAVLLKTIKSIQSNLLKPYYSIEFCFFDGEEIGLYGSTHYVENSNRAIKLYFNIDTCGNPDLGLGFAYSSYTPYMAQSFKEMQTDLKIKMIVEYDPVGYTTDCAPFEQAKIPFVAVGNEVFMKYQHTPSDDVSHISFSRINRISNSLYKYLKNQ
jgi:hypothetical protein